MMQFTVAGNQLWTRGACVAVYTWQRCQTHGATPAGKDQGLARSCNCHLTLQSLASQVQHGVISAVLLPLCSAASFV